MPVHATSAYYMHRRGMQVLLGATGGVASMRARGAAWRARLELLRGGRARGAAAGAAAGAGGRGVHAAGGERGRVRCCGAGPSSRRPGELRRERAGDGGCAQAAARARDGRSVRLGSPGELARGWAGELRQCSCSV
nr:cyclin-dependent kinase inhibitor 3-like [Aegilops tauschii subsp. strangulata]